MTIEHADRRIGHADELGTGRVLAVDEISFAEMRGNIGKDLLEAERDVDQARSVGAETDAVADLLERLSLLVDVDDEALTMRCQSEREAGLRDQRSQMSGRTRPPPTQAILSRGADIGRGTAGVFGIASSSNTSNALHVLPSRTSASARL